MLTSQTSVSAADVCGLWSWGWNPRGQLGREDKGVFARSTEEPNYVRHLRYFKVLQIACSHHYSALITSVGDLYTWGDGGFGKLGHGDTLDQPFPKKVVSLNNVTNVSCGTAHTICITSRGDIFSWGSGIFGALGHGNTAPELNPKRMSFGKWSADKVTQVSACGNHSAAVTTSGSLYTWGYNKYSQLGCSTQPQENAPTHVDPLIGQVSSVVCGEKHTMAMGKKGELWSWGSNEFGQLGFSKTTINYNVPTKVKLGHADKPREIACGSEFSLAISTENAAYTWGCSDDGQLGHVQTTYTATDKTSAIDIRPKYTPQLLEAEFKTDAVGVDSNSKKSVKVAPLKLRTASCGNNHCAGISEDLKLWTWGWDKHGELGYRKEVDILGPRKVEPVRRVEMVACGGYHTLAVVRGQYVAIQLAIDNQVQELSDFLYKFNSLLTAVDDENGYNLFHWAAYLGHLGIIKVLSTRGLSYMELLLGKENEGRTPLHLAVLQGHLDCVQEIIRLVNRDDLNPVDQYLSTPLHYAVKKGHLQISYALIEARAQVNLLDDAGKSAFFYCDNERNSFDLKVAAYVHDVILILHTDAHNFAKKLTDEMEQLHVRAFLPSLTNFNATAYNEKLLEGKCVLFIVSDESAKSDVCLDHLKAAKKANKPIFSVWYHKPKLDSTLESLIFRRQLVDFSDPVKFNDSVSSLVGGLKQVIALGEVEEEPESASDDPTMELIDSADMGTHSYVFLAFDAADKQVAAGVEQAFSDNEIKVKKATDSLQQTSKHILHCAACVIILSDSSLVSKKVHDYVALAENHKKPLFPLFLSSSLELDPATQYTLAEAPRFYFTQHCLSQLASALQISFKIMHHRSTLAQHALHVTPTPVVVANGTNGTSNEAAKTTYWTF